MLSRRKFVLFTLASLTAGCTTQEAFRIARSVATTGSVEGALASTAKNKAVNWAVNPHSFSRDLKRFEQFLSDVAQTWGSESGLRPEEKVYVKYTDQYRSRSVIDFSQGKVRIETLEKPLLKEAIIASLLSSSDPSKVDLFSASPIPEGDEPFLFKQVQDHEGKDIRWRWRAERYANYLIQNHLKQRNVTFEGGNTKTEYFVEFPLVAKHQLQRRYRYQNYVLKYSRQYNIEPALVFAVIETESNFNPFAMSWVPAFGLMQIVPKTAGRDAYEEIHGRPGTPDAQYLFNVENNIRMGCAYIHLLQSRYLEQVRHPLSREYCVIAAYNGGIGNVLRSFNSNRGQAIARINQLSPQKVYSVLRQKMPAESQRYLVKVTQAKTRYV